MVLLSLFLINEIEMKKEDEFYDNILQYINYRKAIQNDGVNIKDKRYKPKSFFKFNDKGTSLNEDIGEIEFIALETEPPKMNIPKGYTVCEQRFTDKYKEFYREQMYMKKKTEEIFFGLLFLYSC